MATTSNPYDRVYQARRIALATAISAAAGRALTLLRRDEQSAVKSIVSIVEAGQGQTVAAVDAYMATKALQITGSPTVFGLDPAIYTISTLRGIPAFDVYQRAFNTITGRTVDAVALERAQGALDKLVRTDLQLAQTHAARDWMRKQAETATGDLKIVGYKRILTGHGPHCRLCELASTRIYFVADLMPIHEHCGCTVEPVWGRQNVQSVGTVVRVEHDPEIGPRLMADNWKPVGPTLVT
jgi:hypothetical protein